MVFCVYIGMSMLFVQICTQHFMQNYVETFTHFLVSEHEYGRWACNNDISMVYVSTQMNNANAHTPTDHTVNSNTICASNISNCFKYNGSLG